MTAEEAVAEVVVSGNQVFEKTLTSLRPESSKSEEKSVATIVFNKQGYKSIKNLGGEIIVPKGLDIDDVFSFIGAEVRFPVFNIKMKIAEILESEFVISLTPLKRINTLSHFKLLFKKQDISDGERNFLEREVIEMANKDSSFTGLAYKTIREYLAKLEQLN